MIKNQRGSSLIIVLMIIAGSILAALTIMQSNANLSQIYARKNIALTADNVVQTIGTLMSDPNVCLNGLDSSGGIKFLNSSGGVVTFNPSAATQDISLPSNFPGTSPHTHLRFAALPSAQSIPDTALTLKRVYATHPVSLGSGAYTMTLRADFDAADSSGSRGLSSRTLMNLKIQTNAAGVVISCGLAPSTSSNQQLCEGMHCTYRMSASGQANCYCPPFPVTCLNGTYIDSIVNRVATCSTSTVSRTCASTTNGYIVGFYPDTQPVCGVIDSCPTGTSGSGLGGAVGATACRCASAGATWDSTSSSCIGRTTCPVGQVWDGTACVPSAPTCPTGTATSNTGGPSNVVGCFCPAGQTWDSPTSACVTSPSPLCYYFLGTTGCRDFPSDPCVLQNVDHYFPNLSYSSMLCTPSPYVMCGGGSMNTEPIYAGDARAAFCNGPYTPSGLAATCGTAATSSSATAPQVNLCATGILSSSVTDGGTTWNWTCAGLSNSVSCSASKIASGHHWHVTGGTCTSPCSTLPSCPGGLNSDVTPCSSPGSQCADTASLTWTCL